MTEQELIELLADKEHNSWARWTNYLFNRCDLERGKDSFRYVIPRELVERWKRQIDTPYADLSEQEKQSDRDEVEHILPIIKKFAEEAIALGGLRGRTLTLRWIDSEREHVYVSSNIEEIQAKVHELLCGDIQRIKIES
jgi:hypothetical protein